MVTELWQLNYGNGGLEFCVNGQTDGVFRLTQRREYDHIKIQSRANRWAAI